MYLLAFINLYFFTFYIAKEKAKKMKEIVRQKSFNPYLSLLARCRLKNVAAVGAFFLEVPRLGNFWNCHPPPPHHHLWTLLMLVSSETLAISVEKLYRCMYTTKHSSALKKTYVECFYFLFQEPGNSARTTLNSKREHCSCSRCSTSSVE